MSRAHLIILFALVGALSLGGVACGGSTSGESNAPSASATADGMSEAAEEEEEAATPAEAAAEIDTIVAMLDSAVADVRAGKRDAASETVGDAYLEHFEHVEDPLGDRDHDLMEDLEERISTELRRKISDGASADEVAQLVDDTKDDLEHAKELLAS